MRIIIVEDNVLQLNYLTDALTQRGLRPCGFNTADEALRALCPKKYDILLSDYRIGADTGCRVVAAATRVGIPSVVMTAVATREEVARSVNLGARFVVLKPFDCDELVQKLRDAVMEQSLSAQLDKILRKAGGIR